MDKIIKPFHNFVLLRILPKAGVTEGGIQLPDATELEPEKGEVIAVGPGHWEYGVFVKMSIKVGDVVYLGRYKGALGVRIKGQLHVIVPEPVCVASVEIKA